MVGPGEADVSDEARERRVMLVDDDGVCLAMLARGLRKRGYAVATFNDPLVAMERLERERPAAVVTDIRMPGMSGLEVVREVRERLGEDAPPVVVVSAEGDEAILTEAFRLGAVDYLVKPVSDVELGVKLQRALERAGPRSEVAAIPRRLGSWTLEECVGRGGCACVFRAGRDGDPEPRALKVVWPHLVASTETMLRFRREIDTLAALEHPGLVRFVESGREKDLYYYVMEYVPGGTLRDRMRAQGAGRPGEVLALLGALAAPLGYLHERGLVHRDVKPSNVFFRAGAPVLGDFGLIRRLVDHGVTLEHEFIGTPLYLAPEVFRSRSFDQSVDLYGLGVCALEWLLGEPPLRDVEPLHLVGHLLAEGIPAPADLLPDLPAPLAALLARLVARDRAARLGSAAELATEVARVQAELEG